MIMLNGRETVYQDIQRKISEGEFAAGSPLPSLRNLSNDYDTSVSTVRQALDQLRIEGELLSRHGKGNYVADKKLQTKNVMLIAELQGDVFSELVNAFSTT